MSSAVSRPPSPPPPTCRNWSSAGEPGGTRALSRRALIVLAVGFSFWVVYGVVREDVLVAIGNLIALTITLALLSLKARFG
jgi:hypothetical protein